MDSNVQFRENQGWHSATHFLIMKSLSAADSPPIELTEEDRPGETKPGEDSHWHTFHIIDRRMA